MSLLPPRRRARHRRRNHAAPSSPPAGGLRWRSPPAGCPTVVSLARSAARGARNGHHTGMAILGVDDDQAVRDSLRRALSLQGYSVELAADGLEALEKLEHDGAAIELLVVDVLMPGLDGLEVTRQLRADGSALP